MSKEEKVAEKPAEKKKDLSNSEEEAKNKKLNTGVTVLEEEAKPVVDNQTVVLTKKAKFFVGNNPYEFKAGVKYAVPADVKKILVIRGIVKASY